MGIHLWIRRWYYARVTRYRRLELRLVDYKEGDRLIRASPGLPAEQRWGIACREEDGNRMAGLVYLERKIRRTE
jgi:hypothetical protein